MSTSSWSEIYGQAAARSRPSPEREDILFEGLVNADGSGVATGDHLDTRGFTTVWVTGKFLSPSSPSAAIEHFQMDTSSSPRIIKTEALTVSTSGFFSQQVRLVGRAVRLVAYGADTGGVVALTIRKV